MRRKHQKNQFFLFSFTLENNRFGTAILSIARSFEKESYLEEVKIINSSI